MNKLTYQIVGGNFGDNIKSSSIVNKIAEYINSDDINVINGGTMEDLPKELNGDLNIWMPNIKNEEEKHYPKKPIGSVLICSKVMREGYTNIDAVSRIFKMHGNAVITITPISEKCVKFQLIDALNNIWYDGSDIKELVFNVLRFYIFTKNAVRINTNKKDIKEIESNICGKNNELDKLVLINNLLASNIMSQCGNRFFGNLSTRCQQLFPSHRDANNTTLMYVSPRNSDKAKLQTESFIIYDSNNNYYGDVKPSIDSPCQIIIYKNIPSINYMIHGHAFIKNAPTTKKYFLCGDIKESDEIIDLINQHPFTGAINLKNHGFIIYADNIENLNNYVNNLVNNKETFFIN